VEASYPCDLRVTSWHQTMDESEPRCDKWSARASVQPCCLISVRGRNHVRTDRLHSIVRARACRFTVPALRPLFGLFGPHATPPANASVANDPNVWSGRALQEDFVELAASGLASMYPAFVWSVGSWPSWISARLRDRPRPGQSGHQCSQTPGRPNLHLVSSSRRPRQVAVNSSCRLSA
jgi:hypothetical protein